jgi:hypothetical protein
LADKASAALASQGPETLAVVKGHVIGVAQTDDSVAWLESTTSGCRLRTRSRNSGSTRAFRYSAGCLPDQDLALIGERAAWGGYEDVRCSETTAAVYAEANDRARLLQEIPGDCLGYGKSFQGLVSDGSAFFFSLLVTSSKAISPRCGEGGACRFQLSGGSITRLTRTRVLPVRGLPPAVLLAASSGRIALVAPAHRGASSGRGRLDWPRAALDGRVQIRNTSSAGLVSSFRPAGLVRAVSLSTYRAVVLVQSKRGRRIEWYDADSGARLGAEPVPPATATISTDGRLVAFAAGATVHVLDLETGAERVLRHAPGEVVGVSVDGGRVVWGENVGSRGRILTAFA